MRETIPVPALPMESIRSRSHAARAQGRIKIFVACAAISVGALGAGTGVGAKIYNGVHVWLSGSKATSMVHSGVIMRYPMASDLHRAIAGATFPVVFPVGVPAGSQVYMITSAPDEHPSVITVSYQNNGTKFKSSFALADPAVVDTGRASLPTGSALPPLQAVYHWQVGGEIVAVLEKNISLRDMNQIKAAMMKASPLDSLAVTDAMLPKLIVLGGTVRLEVAEQYRPANTRSVLIDEAYVRTIPGLVEHAKPMIDQRITRLTNVTYAKGDISKAVVRQPKDIAVSSGGVRAIDAVLRSTGERRDRACGCEILFNQPSRTTYWVWKIPLSASAGARKYSVDASTFAVTPSTEGDSQH